MNIDELESLLRNAPAPKPPPGLDQTLMAAAKLPSAPAVSNARAMPRVSPAWFKRWWPVVAPGALAAFCMTVIAVQQIEIRELTAAVEVLRANIASADARMAIAPGTSMEPPDIATPAAYEEEAARLNLQAARLEADIQQLQALRAENESLLAQLPALSSNLPPEFRAMEEARQAAMSNACLNNLRQISMAANRWAREKGNGLLPPDLGSLQELFTGKSLPGCPAFDPNRPLGTASVLLYPSFEPYEFLPPSSHVLGSNVVIILRCTIHQHVGTSDGAAYPAVRLDDKLYLSNDPPAP